MNYICRLLIFLEITHQAITQASGPEVLVSEPSSGVIKEGEEFKLHCRNSGKVIDVDWFKNNIYLPEIHSEFYESLADSSSGGSYQCHLLSNQWERSKPLDVVTIASDMILTLEVNPTAALSGEQIILKCLFSDQKGPEFLWYRKEELIQQTDKSQYIIAKAEITDESSYRCECKIDYRKWVSPEVNITVTDHDVAFQVDPPSVLEGDVLNLNCRYRNYYYLWKDVGFYKGIRKIHSMNLNNWKALHSFRVNSSKDSGSYHCTIDDKISRSVDVHVHELFAKPKLRTEPAVEIFEGDQLKLICFVETMRANIGVQYSFYQKGKALKLNADNNHNYIEAASLRDSGTYLCEANVVYRGVKKTSDEVSIEIKEVFSEPTLMAEYEAQLLEGQQLKLACSVEIFRSHSSLRFVFYKDGQPLNSAAEHNYYIKETFQPDDSGIYRCEATTLNSEVTKRSNPISVSVRRIPVSKPELAISPGEELMEADTALLTCSVFNGSTPITYIFYKAPNKELFRGESNLTTITYQVGEVSQSTQGDYWCAVSNEATGHPLLHSDVLAVSLIVPVAGVSLNSNRNKTEISAGDRLVLQCLVKGGTALHFRWYLNNKRLITKSESYHLNTDGSELIINSFQRGHGGRYHCVVNNRGSNGWTVNTTSNYIDVTLPAHHSTIVITATVLPLFLIAALIALVFFRRRQKKQDNSSRVSQSQGVATVNRSPSPTEGTAESNFEYAAVGSARNTDDTGTAADLVYSEVTIRKSRDCDDTGTAAELVYSEVTIRKSRDCDDTRTAAELVYSEVTIRKSRDCDNDGGPSGRKQGNKNGHGDYCVTYATVNRANTEASLEGGPIEESCFYENLPRK